MKIFKVIFSRLTLILVAFTLEILITFAIFHWFNEKATWIETVLRVLSVLIVLMIVKNSKHLSTDVIWIIMIIAFPVPGTILYLLIGANLLTSITYRELQSSTSSAHQYYQQDSKVFNELIEKDPYLKGQFHYISKTAGFPFYRNSGFEYYSFGQKGFPEILKELEKAEKFIFLEYFIIKQGRMWDRMINILKQKAAQGVDVRVMYDDYGSFFSLSSSYVKMLEQSGIKCVSFNRINPIIGVIMNHRDHRKIMVIDGKTAFTGGINIGDEYINARKRFGIWKDNVIKVSGQAVWSYTVMFLTHWNALRKQDESYLPYKTKTRARSQDGYIAPYGDTPLDDENTSQNIYISILNQAKDYCYISTPYLIIDTEMINALVSAAKRGIDVRIITPGIPDKRIVFYITRSYYRTLIENGIRIYEYTPGFIHSKVFVCDDDIATVGTINLDYRSLYLHFENGTYIYGSSKISSIKKDLCETIEVSRQISLQDCSYPLVIEFILAVLRLVAPLL